jgi:hypothetical protein
VEDPATSDWRAATIWEHGGVKDCSVPGWVSSDSYDVVIMLVRKCTIALSIPELIALHGQTSFFLFKIIVILAANVESQDACLIDSNSSIQSDQTY